jgi:Fe-Mn family superoxide dismutase
MKKFELPAVPYSYDALEPHIDARTMEIHHTKHHQAYTDGLNKALENLEGQNIQIPETVEEIISNLAKFPEGSRSALNFHGGGYDNHKIFWNNMRPGGGGEPSGDVADAINEAFGNFAAFKERFSKETATIQGSGWGWLAFNPKTGKVEFVTMPNQTSPRTKNVIPLLGLDMWEHAFYLKYQNRKQEYISAWWNVINWQDVEERLKRVLK